jgi:hypothetical protein
LKVEFRIVGEIDTFTKLIFKDVLFSLGISSKRKVD